MSNNPAPLDPYQPPVMEKFEGIPQSISIRPRWLNLIAILAIVLGVMGLMNSVSAVGMAIFSSKFQGMMQNMQRPPGNGPANEIQKANEKFQAEVQAINDRLFIVNLSAGLFHFVVAVLLTVGGTRTLNLSSGGRQMLVYAFFMAILFELARMVLAFYVFAEMRPALTHFMDDLTANMPKQNGDAQWMSTLVQVTMTVSLIIQIVLVSGKILFYGLSARYLGKPECVLACGGSLKPL